jgi:hypothetical protein
MCAPTLPIPITSARVPPIWEDDPEPMSDWDPLGQPEADIEFDQRITW